MLINAAELITKRKIVGKMGSGVTTSLESQMKSACLASTAGFSPADEINSPTATAAAAWQEIGHNRAFNWVCLLVFRRATKSVKSTAVFNFIFITSSVTQTVSSRDILLFLLSAFVPTDVSLTPVNMFSCTSVSAWCCQRLSYSMSHIKSTRV